MGSLFENLMERSRLLLNAVAADAEPGEVQRLLDDRREVLEALVKAGEPIPADGMSELHALQARVTEAIIAQRDAAAGELRQLRRARSASAAYGPVSDAPSRYLDREG